MNWEATSSQTFLLLPFYKNYFLHDPKWRRSIHYVVLQSQFPLPLTFRLDLSISSQVLDRLELPKSSAWFVVESVFVVFEVKPQLLSQLFLNHHRLQWQFHTTQVLTETSNESVHWHSSPSAEYEYVSIPDTLLLEESKARRQLIQVHSGKYHRNECKV